MTGPPYPLPPVAGSNAIGTFPIGVGSFGDIPLLSPWSTIIGQYGNSPIIDGLITSMSSALDQTALWDAFYDAIWNPSTAFGYGLDIWGRIVGVSRMIKIPEGIAFFGWTQAGDPGWGPNLTAPTAPINAMLNPNDFSLVTLSNSDLTATSTGTNGQIRSTLPQTNGRRHFEVTDVLGASGGNFGVGISSLSHSLATQLGFDAYSVGIWNFNPVQAKRNSVTTFTAAAGTMTTGDTIAYEIDLDAQLIWYQNVTSGPANWNDSATANPVTGVGGISYAAAGLPPDHPYYITLDLYTSGFSGTVNFGAQAFALAPSAGYQAWSPVVPGGGATPASQGGSPWYSGQKLPITTSFELTDAQFRRLIFARALANISDGSIPSMYASEVSAPGPQPSIARPRVM